MLEKYTPEQLITIIQNIAPSGLLDWAEGMDKDLTDPQILRKYNFHMDGLRDYFTQHREELSVMMSELKKKYDREETIEHMMRIFDLNHYEAKLYVDRNWE